MRRPSFLQAAIFSLALLTTSCSHFPPKAEEISQQYAALLEAKTNFNEAADFNLLIHIADHVAKAEIEKSLSNMQDEFLTLSNLDVRFSNQLVLLRGQFEYNDTIDKTMYAGSFDASVSLAVSGADIVWLPYLRSFELTKAVSTDTDYSSIAPAANAVLSVLMKRINGHINKKLFDADANRIILDIAPFRTFDFNSQATQYEEILEISSSIPLEGVFTISEASLLVDKGGLSVLARIEFGSLETKCRIRRSEEFRNDPLPQIKRSYFSRGIHNQEPTGFDIRFFDDDDALYFFTEVLSKENGKILHRWRQNGTITDKSIPLEFDEVGDNGGFRTFSKKENFLESNHIYLDVRTLAEDECLLERRTAVRTARINYSQEELDVSRAAVKDLYKDYKKGFENASSNAFPRLSYAKGTQVAISTSVLASTLNTVLQEPNLVVSFDVTKLIEPETTSSKLVGPFNNPPSHMGCDDLPNCGQILDRKDCRQNGDCTPTRDCGGYEWYQAPDKLRCEAEKSGEKFDCERLKSQKKMSCEVEKQAEYQSCQVGRSAQQVSCVAARQIGESIFGWDGVYAIVDTYHKAEGGNLLVGIENIKLSPDFRSYDADVLTTAEAQISGKVVWTPANLIGPLVCLKKWTKPVEFTVYHRQTETNIRNSPVRIEEGEELKIVFATPEVKFDLDAEPSPFEEIFLENPDVASTCLGGLTFAAIKDIHDRLLGKERSSFWTGDFDLKVKQSENEVVIRPIKIGGAGTPNLILHPKWGDQYVVFGSN